MITKMTLVPIHGARLSCGSAATYVNSWKPRPPAAHTIVTRLGGSLVIDNSTRVSAVERRHR